MVVALTGGSGHLGSNLILQLLASGHKVNALCYREKVPIDHENLTWLTGDVRKESTFQALLSGAEVLIHSAAVISIGLSDPNIVWDVNVNGTKHAIAACFQQNIRLIYISSSHAVEELPVDEVWDESRPLDGKDAFPYARSKAESERMVNRAVNEDGLDAIILRPTSMVGPPDFKPSLMGQAIQDFASGKMPFATTGGYNLVDVRDISKTIINAIEQGKSGETYVLGGSYVRIAEIANTADMAQKSVSDNYLSNFYWLFCP